MTVLRVISGLVGSMVLYSATFVAQIVIPDEYAAPALIALIVMYAGLMGWIVRSLIALESRVARLEGVGR